MVIYYVAYVSPSIHLSSFCFVFSCVMRGREPFLCNERGEALLTPWFLLGSLAMRLFPLMLYFVMYCGKLAEVNGIVTKENGVNVF